MMKKYVTVLVLVAVANVGFCYSQTNLVGSMQIVNKQNGTSQLFQASPSATESQGFNFPNIMGTSGQIIGVQGTTGGVASTAWSNASGSFASFSGVSTVATSDGNAWANAVATSVAANTKYRVTGQFEVYRDAGTNASDQVNFRLDGLPGRATSADPSSSAEFIVECLNCGAGTWSTAGGNNTFSLAAVASVTNSSTSQLASTNSVSFDPGGATNSVGSANSFFYRVEGVIITSTTPGSITFGFNKNGGNNTTWLASGAFFTLIPLP